MLLRMLRQPLPAIWPVLAIVLLAINVGACSILPLLEARPLIRAQATTISPAHALLGSIDPRLLSFQPLIFVPSEFARPRALLDAMLLFPLAVINLRRSGHRYGSGTEAKCCH